MQDKAAQILLKSHLDAAVNQSGKLGMQIEAPQQRKAECGMALKANAEAALEVEWNKKIKRWPVYWIGRKG